MVVVGSDTIFLSHLPMPHSPHDYQVLIEASFGPVDDTYRADRKAHPDARFYTFAPEQFVLPELFPGDPDRPAARTSFAGSLVRNHFERPPAHLDEPVTIAADVTVEVANVVHHHQFDQHGAMLDHLTYLLVGKGADLFLAHRITRPPDFDQLLSVRLRDASLTADLLRRSIEITLPRRPNRHDDRIAEGETVAALARIGGKEVPIVIDASLELYVDTADLA
jgi:hypothetical protein